MQSSKRGQKEALLNQLLSRDNPPYNDEDNKMKYNDFNSGNIFESLLSNCFDFAYNEGLSYGKIGTFVRFYQQLIRDSAMKEMPISEAVALLRERTTKFASTGNFKDLSVLSAIEFISITLLQHYHLIVFALCYSRQQDTHLQNVLVEIAPYEVNSLKDGKQIDQWRLEGALEKEEIKFTEKEKVLENTMAETIKAMEDELEDYFTNLSNHNEINVSLIAEIIQNIVSKRGEITRAELEFAMNKSRVLMTKNLALMKVQNEFKESLKKEQQQTLRPPSPPKRTATSTPGKKK